jgi:hypothetical protein
VGKVEARKSKIMKLEQKPCKLVGKNGEDRVIAQLSRFTTHNASVIKGIISPVLPSTTHQSVHDMTPNLYKKLKT